MHYVLVIKQPNYGTQGAYLGLQIAQSLLEHGHSINQIFFYHEGVVNGNSLASPATDEFNLLKAWQQLSVEFNVPLYLCIAAAQRRGVIDSSIANDTQSVNLAERFVMAGLGEFSKAVIRADRIITL